MNLLNPFRRAVLVLPAVLLASCKDPASSPAPAGTNGPAVAVTQQVFQVKGVIKEVFPERKKVKIAHEKIPDYMDAMTMTFDVKTPADLARVKPGDTVAFRMVVTSDDGWIEHLTTLAAGATIATSAPPTFRRVREVEPLNVGDLVPDYSFTNQLGQIVRLSEFKGQAVGLTFIFTRCPFPTFCPRMSENFEKAHQRLRAQAGGPTNWHLFSVSFDPEFDTPEKLKAYAHRYKPDPRHWSFVTGDLTELTAITEQFGLQFWKEGGTINHNLRTVVIDTAGRVQRVFRENEWTAEELAGEMIKAAAVKPASGG